MLKLESSLKDQKKGQKRPEKGPEKTQKKTSALDGKAESLDNVEVRILIKGLEKKTRKQYRTMNIKSEPILNKLSLVSTENELEIHVNE